MKEANHPNPPANEDAEPSEGTGNPKPAGGFHTTRWSIVIQAGGDGEAGKDALADLCRSYWYPLYAFVRSKGYSQEDAEDRTQGFFVQLLERNDITKASKERGKFRSFLLTALTNYLTSEWRKENAIKRGRDIQLVEIDAQEGEERLQNEPKSTRTPEDEFDRRWAMTTLDEATAALRKAYAEAGKEELFEALRPGLTGGREVGPYAELAAQHGMTPGAITMAVKRLRARFANCIREEVMKTVDSEENFDSEMNSLYAALGN